jgi:hypothetical protein
MSESNHIYIVYKTTNLVNQKIYIGVHHQKFHFPILFEGYLGSGMALNMAIKKYGKENFIRETLFVYYTSEEAYAKEREIVNKAFIARKDTYNCCGGGMGPSFHSEETKKKLSKIGKTKKGELNSFYDKEHTEETKQKIGDANRGRKHTEEAKKKMSLSRSGENHPMYGKHHTEETKQKISKKNAGKKKPPRTEEHKRNNALAIKGYKHTDTAKQNMSKAHLGTKHEIVKCPHCNKEGGKPAMTRNHFDNCLLKPNQDIERIKMERRRKTHKKHKQTEIVICPVCGKEGGISAMKRWHFDNCKTKTPSFILPLDTTV